MRQWLYENFDLVTDAVALQDKGSWIEAAGLYDDFLKETGTTSTTISAGKFKDALLSAASASTA